MENQLIFIRIATLKDFRYVDEIIRETAASAAVRGSGIANRRPEAIIQKMKEGRALVAVTSTEQWVGFAYYESWDNGRFISNSGLIVAPEFRKLGVAKAIKERIFRICRRKYPDAKIFSITSGAAIMKMNSELGFKPVVYNHITQEKQFWEGCKQCVNYDILEQKKGCNCLCTAMVFDPLEITNIVENYQPCSQPYSLSTMKKRSVAY